MNGREAAAAAAFTTAAASHKKRHFMDAQLKGDENGECRSVLCATFVNRSRE
jgi:hypothetical protein